MSKLSVTLVYNPASGSAMSLDDLHELFDKHDVVIDSTVTISKTLKRELRAPTKSGATIATVGGDGTISAVAGLIAGTGATLLPLPGGTLNNFTKDLGVPQDIDKALGHAVAAKPRAIDIASVNDNYFVNNSSIGLYPQSLQTRKRIEDRLGKWPAAVIGGIRALVRFRTYSVTIGNETLRTPFVFVGNNDYRLQTKQGPHRTQLDKGVLCVYIVKASTRLGLVRLFIVALFGRLRSEKSFDYRTAQSMTIDSDKHRSVHVSHDGELTTLSMPITYQIHGGTLNIRG